MNGNRRIELVVPGKPMAWSRGVPKRAGKFVKTFNPTDMVNYQVQIKERFFATYPNWELLDTGLILLVKAYFVPPKGTSQKKLAAMLEGRLRPEKKPDFDNLAKIVGDALNQVAYTDDKLIVTGTAEKWYDMRPRLEIYIWEWDVDFHREKQKERLL